MKITITAFFIAFLFLSINNLSNAQIEEDYHTAVISVSIPVIVDHYEVSTRNGEIISDKHIPDQQGGIRLAYRANDLKANGNYFSGIYLMFYGTRHQIETYYGKISDDKQTMEFIELTKDDIVYSSADRDNAYLQSKVTASARFENLPVLYGHYKYKYDVSKITSVGYQFINERRYMSGGQFKRDSMISINQEKINQHSQLADIQFQKGQADASKQNPINIVVGAHKSCTETGKKLEASIINYLTKFKAPLYADMYKGIMNSEITDNAGITESELVNPETGKVADINKDNPVIEIIVDETHVGEDKNLPLELHSLKVLIKYNNDQIEINPDDISNLDDMPHQVLVNLIEIMN